MCPLRRLSGKAASSPGHSATPAFRDTNCEADLLIYAEPASSFELACFTSTMRFLSLLLALAPAGGVFGLWPQPRSLETGSTALKLASNFDIHVDIQHAPSDLSAAIARTQSFLRNDKLGRLVVGRGSSDSDALKQAKALKTLQLSLSEGATVRSITEEARQAIGTRSEEYVLSIPADGSGATLTANSTLGLFRGLTTFTQLFYEWSGQVYTVEAPISITDAPAYVSRILA